MREYAKISPKFWTGKTGRAIKKRGTEGVVVALYLMSSPHSNMLGLFYQPLLYLAEETGLSIEGASKGLRDCIEAGFCVWDEDSRMVWVFEMAEYQIAEELSPGDKRCKGVQREYDALPDCPFLGRFYERYAGPFHMTDRRQGETEQAAPPPTSARPTEAPSKPLRSQEQEQEQEQAQEQDPPSGVAAKSPRPAKKAPRNFAVTEEMRAWAADKAAGISVQDETEKFLDHTFRIAISDWPGAWRNWMRNAKKFADERPPPARRPPSALSDAERAAQDAQANEEARKLLFPGRQEAQDA